MAVTPARIEELQGFSASLSDPGFFTEVLNSLSDATFDGAAEHPDIGGGVEIACDAEVDASVV